MALVVPSEGAEPAVTQRNQLGGQVKVTWE